MPEMVELRAPDRVPFTVRVAGYGSVALNPGESRKVPVQSAATIGYIRDTLDTVREQARQDAEEAGEDVGHLGHVWRPEHEDEPPEPIPDDEGEGEGTGEEETPENGAETPSEGIDPDAHLKDTLVAAADDHDVDPDGRTKEDYADALADAGLTDEDVEAYVDEGGENE